MTFRVLHNYVEVVVVQYVRSLQCTVCMGVSDEALENNEQELARKLTKLTAKLMFWY
jgi:hypothetical protein